MLFPSSFYMHFKLYSQSSATYTIYLSTVRCTVLTMCNESINFISNHVEMFNTNRAAPHINEPKSYWLAGRIYTYTYHIQPVCCCWFCCCFCCCFRFLSLQQVQFSLHHFVCLLCGDFVVHFFCFVFRPLANVQWVGKLLKEIPTAAVDWNEKRDRKGKKSMKTMNANARMITPRQLKAISDVCCRVASGTHTHIVCMFAWHVGISHIAHTAVVQLMRSPTSSSMRIVVVLICVCVNRVGCRIAIGAWTLNMVR